MEITVTLQPHVGKKRVRFGIVDVEHNQWMVYASSDQQPKPQFVGYIGKDEGSPFNGYTTYRDLPTSLKKEIVSQVEQLVGWKCEAFEPSTAPVPSEAFEPEADDESEE